MRTTITIDPDVEALVRKAMSERGAGLKQVVNDALRRGLGGTSSRAYRLAPHSMGKPRVPLDGALALAARLEDEEITRKMAQRR
jgi:hypothetical protein